MTILHCKIAKAKKEHRCDLCGGVIKIGEEYEDSAFLYEGSFATSKAHCHCSWVQHFICDTFDEHDEMTMGELEDMFDDLAIDTLPKPVRDRFDEMTTAQQWQFMYDWLRKEEE